MTFAARIFRERHGYCYDGSLSLEDISRCITAFLLSVVNVNVRVTG